jgi:hypothetical protein
MRELKIRQKLHDMAATVRRSVRDAAARLRSWRSRVRKGTSA